MAVGSDLAEAMPDSAVVGSVRLISEAVDARIRRTDPCGVNPTCGGGASLADAVWPDLLAARIGTWLPTDVTGDLYVGAFASTGAFLRVDLAFRGVVDPPGPMVNSYAPRQYGPNPLVGFVEFDVDTNGDSGGNTEAPLLRYNGNVARFGGVPGGQVFRNRISLDGRDSDGQYATPPWIDRSGADFELEFRGDEVVAVVRVVGDSDLVFEAGETWDIRGRFFRRAQGYANCAGGPYEPLVWVRFAHHFTSSTPTEIAGAPLLTLADPVRSTGITDVTFIYPLTNEAYAAAHSALVEPVDAFDFNANSVEEALLGLQVSSLVGLCPPTFEYAPLIAPWQNENPADYLKPQWWRATMLLGTARPTAVANEGNYIWTDVYPNVAAGDFNGDGLRTKSDAQAVEDYVNAADGVANIDLAPGLDGEVWLVNFGVWFSIYDVNYDGKVEAYDRAYAQQTPGDYDNDGDVDLYDFKAFQDCFTGVNTGALPTPSIACRDAFDANNDLRITLSDYQAFQPLMTGPEAEE